MVIRRIGFVARTEIKNFAFAALPGGAAAKHFAAFEPADEDQFVWRGDIERFAVHFFAQFDVRFNALRDGVGGVYNPDSFDFVRVTPSQRARGAHEAQKYFGEMGRVQRDEAHAL